MSRASALAASVSVGVLAGSLCVIAAACGAFGADAEADSGVDAGPDGPLMCPDAGCPPVMIAKIADPWYLKVDGPNVYVSSKTSGLWRVPTPGVGVAGAPLNLTVRPTWGIALSDDEVYYCALSAGIFKLPKAATSSPTSAVVTSESCRELAFGDGQVFFTSGATKVARIQSDGGTSLAIGSVTASEGIALDKNDVYFADTGMVGMPGEVLHVTTQASSMTKIGEGNRPSRVAVDDKYVYWVDQASAEVKRSSRSVGGGVGERVSTGPGVAGNGGIAVDEAYVYWVVPDAHAVMRAIKEGGPAQPVASGLDQPVDVAVDARAVYFTVAGGAGALVMVQK